MEDKTEELEKEYRALCQEKKSEAKGCEDTMRWLAVGAELSRRGALPLFL